MEKKQYIRPEAIAIELNGEILMLDVSKTETESPGGGATEGPEIDPNPGDGDDY